MYHARKEKKIAQMDDFFIKKLFILFSVNVSSWRFYGHRNMVSLRQFYSMII